MPFLILFLCLPILEIITFIVVSSEIGFLTALAATILTSLAGFALIKLQGVFTLDAVRESLSNRKSPVAEIFGGLFIIIAAVALIIPGFITDFIGLIFLIPALQGFIKARFVNRNNMSSEPSKSTFRNQDIDHNIIEGEYERVDNDKRP